MSLWIQTLELGPMKNFIYLVGAEGHRETAVIDPAWDVDAIFEACENAGRSLTHALVTHRHFDHCNGVPELRKRNIPVYVNRHDSHRLAGDVPPSELIAVEAGDIVDIGALPVRCIHTPGHTAGSQCFHVDAGSGALFSGDTLFVNACGRCDFDDSDARAMFHSLHTVLGALDGSTKLYPGHDYGDVKVSTLARERRLNPYLQLENVEAFVAQRLPPSP